MDILQIEEILLDQAAILKKNLRRDWVSRVEEDLVDLESELAQVIIGVRRSGKSTLCYNIIKKSGKKFVSINFDDERLVNVGLEDLDQIYKTARRLFGEFDYFFLDEVQNIEDWHLFVNRLLRAGTRILMTGSNANLLSGELATHMTGRYSTIELFPFSFVDFCRFQKLDPADHSSAGDILLYKTYENFLKIGGFPELQKIKRSRDYIQNLLKSIIQKDIVRRFRIHFFADFERLANHLLNIAPAVVSRQNLQKDFGLKSPHTVVNYLRYLKEAYVLNGVQKFSFKSRLRLCDEKIYPADVALMDNRGNAFAGENLGFRLETLVFIELLRRWRNDGGDIYYFNNGATEVDFVVYQGKNIKQLVQVCYDLHPIKNPNDSRYNKTYNREVRAFDAILEKLDRGGNETTKIPCLLITNHERGNAKTPCGNAVSIVPAYRWLSNF